MTETKSAQEKQAEDNNVAQMPTKQQGVMQRDLSTADVMQIVGMAGDSLGDPRFDNLRPDASQAQIMIALAGAFLSNSRRQFELLCADLVGISKKYDFKEYKEAEKSRAREEAEEESEYQDNEAFKRNWRAFMDNDDAIRAKMNDDILEEWGNTKPNTLTRLINEVGADPNFPELQSSVMELMQKAGISFGSEQTSSDKKSGGSQKKK